MVDNIRDERIVSNLGLVHSIAHRFVGRGVEYEDLYQAGCIGLIKSVDNFDESRGFAFSTYAVPVIMGEIKRLFRDGGSVKVSRSLKDKSMLVQAARERFRRAELREPTLSELAEITSIGIDELSEVLNILAPVLSLSAENDDGMEIDIPVDDTDELFNRLTISQAMKSLSCEEQSLVKLRYFEGKTQMETAGALGISQVQVSRREKAILQRLRGILSA